MDPETREDLKADVIAGFYNPVVVTPLNVYYGDPALATDQYVIVDGENRWLAAVEADIGFLDVDVKPLTESEARLYCYRMNKVKGAIDPLKEGEFFNLEVEALGSEEAVAERYRRSRSYVAGRRSLVRLAEPVKQLYRKPKKGLEELKKVEIEAGILEDNPDEEYSSEQMEEMVETILEVNEFVPRGTLTASHMEALAGLPEKMQSHVATKIVEENLTVRDTENFVRLVKDKIARRARFEEALERAVQKTCPECGNPPKGFDELYSYGGQDPSFNEDNFDCSSCYRDWPYMKKAPSKEKQLEKARKERSEKLSEANLNPKYIRREEEKDDLIESMRPWVLRKIRQLDEIGTVSIVGLRGDKVVSIDFPSNYGSKLFVRIGDSGADKWHDRFHSMATKNFGFDIEKKVYKSLPFNSKLDVSQGPSPKHRAQVHFFLDHVLKTDEDPFLPEDEELVKDILRKYGELEAVVEVLQEQPDDDVVRITDLEPEETPKDLHPDLVKRVDGIIDQFLESDEDAARVVVTGLTTEGALGLLQKRIIDRAITGNVEASMGADGEAYLERPQEAEE
jgi:ParB-like chromosome segregation protein Spo0J